MGIGIGIGVWWPTIKSLALSLISKLRARADYFENKKGTEVILGNLENCQYPPSTENLLEKASIVTTPTAYDDGKLLSAKPSNGENYTLYSEDFTQWGNNNVTITDTTAPDGTQTAKQITANSTASNAGVSQIFTTSDTIHTISCFIQKGTHDIVRLQVYDGNSGTRMIFFNLNTETITYTQGNVLSSGFENYSNNWYRLFITATTQGNATFYVGFDGTQSIGETLNIYGYQIERGSKLNPYIKTDGSQIINGDFNFSRGSSATRVNSSGLIEDVRILSSELVQNGDFSQEGSELVTNGDFSTDSNWTIDQNEGISISNGKLIFAGQFYNQFVRQGSVLSPDKCFKITVEVSQYTSGSFRIVSQNYVNTSEHITSEGVHTFYFKCPSDLASGNFFIIGQGLFASIDNVSVKEVGQNWTLGDNWSIGENKAIVTNSVAGQSIYQSILTVGKKYRVQFDILSISSNGVRIGIGTNFSSYFTTTGTHTFEGITAGDALMRINPQIGTTASVSNITVKEITDDTDLPRIDYTDGVGHILLEPESTNLVTYSEDFSQWDRVNNLTLTTDTTVKNPDGTDSKRFIKSGSGTTIAAEDNVTVASGQNYTFSVYAKSGTSENARLEVGDGPDNFVLNYDFNSNSFTQASDSGLQTLLDYKAELFSNGWYRICGTFSNAVNQVNVTLYGEGSVNDYMYFWGAQLEQKSFPTSYIPTVGSSATRLNETCNNSGNSSLFNDTEGVLYAEIAALADDLTERSISLASGNSNNRVTLQYKNVSNQVQGIYRLSSTNTGDVNFTLQNTKEFNKIAFKYKQNDFALWVNGTKVATDNSGSTGSIGITALSFDRLNTNSVRFLGKTKCVAVFKEALTDEELACLTSYTIEDALHSIDSRAAQKSFNFFKFGDFKTRLKKLF